MSTYPIETKLMLGLLLLVGFIIAILDLRELKKDSGYLSWGQAYSAQKQALLFFIAVTLVFAGIQFGLNALFPQASQIGAYIFRYKGITDPNLSVHISIFSKLKVFLLLLWSFFVIGFWDYLSHRFVLHHRFFWVFHEYHHLPNQVFALTPGIWTRPYVFLNLFITYFPSFPFIGLALKLFADLPTTIYFVQNLPLMILFLGTLLEGNHSYYLRKQDWANRWFCRLQWASPAEHILHHSRKLHGNYGNFTVLWDRLFNTYLSPVLHDPLKEDLGLDYDQDFLGTLCLGKFRLSQKIRDKYEVSHLCNLTKNESL